MPRILLLDDDIAEISGVKRLLARAGHAAELATNAADALTAVERAAPDLLVLAAACDGGRALALAQRLAGRRSTAALPMLILGEAPGLPSGVRKLPRPVDPEQLGAAIDELLGGARTAPPPARSGAGAGPAPTGAAASAPPAAPSSRAAAAEALRAHAEAMRRSGEAKVVAARPVSAAKAAATTTTPGDSSRAPAPARASSPAQGRPSTPTPTPTQPPRPTLDVDSELEDLLRYIGGEPDRASPAPAPSSSPAPAPAQPATPSPAPSSAPKSAPSSSAPTSPAPSSARATSPASSSAPSSARAASPASSSAPSSTRATSSAPSSAPPPKTSSAASPARSPATDLEALRAQEAEEQAAAEREARRRAEEELERVRRQLEAERRTAEERIASVMEQAAAEELAAEELRRIAEEEARRRAEEEERRLRDAIASAQAELAALRSKGEEEARRRAAVEAELWRVTELASVASPPPVVPPPAFAPYPGLAPAPIAPPAEPAEEAARRRVAALRGPPAAPPPAPEPALDREPAAPAPIAPPPPELRGGTLAELPAPRLLALAARARLAGRLDFEGEVTRSLWFEDGRVVGASSADPGERVEELALRLGLITRDQHRQVAAAAATLPSRRAALLLLERGFLKANELTVLARRRAEEVVFGIFGDEGARFRWVAQEVMPEERTALERAPLALAVEGVRRRWRAPHLERVLGGPGTLLSPAPDGPSAGELGLSAEERRAVALADGLRALDEIVHASPLDDVSTRQVLAALVLVGALSVRLLQAGRPAAGAARAIDLARVGDKLDQVRRADYFTVLGVGRRCTPHEIREAAERLESEFDPRRHAGSGHEGLAERLEEILQVIRDARDVLTDDRLREAYLGGLGD